MYPFLRELLDEGYLEDGWEDPAKTHGSPPRRFYRLTDAGVLALREFVNAAPQRAKSRRHSEPRLIPGQVRTP